MSPRLVFPMLLAGVATVAGAVELGDDCKPVVAAMEKTVQADHAATITQGAITTHEVTSGGQSWIESGGRWGKSPLTPQEFVEKGHEDIEASRRFACTPLPDAVVDGVAVVVYALHIEPRTGHAIEGRLAVALSTGLIVSSQTDASGKDVVGRVTHFRYDDVKAPM